MAQLEGKVGGDVAHDHETNPVMFLADREEVIPPDGLEPGGIGDHPDGGRAGAEIHQGHLPKDLALTQVDHGARFWILWGTGVHNLHQALPDHEQLIACGPLLGDHFTGTVAAFLADAGDLLQFGRCQAIEQFDLAEDLGQFHGFAPTSGLYAGPIGCILPYSEARTTSGEKARMVEWARRLKEGASGAS